MALLPQPPKWTLTSSKKIIESYVLGREQAIINEVMKRMDVVIDERIKRRLDDISKNLDDKVESIKIEVKATINEFTASSNDRIDALKTQIKNQGTELDQKLQKQGKDLTLLLNHFKIGEDSTVAPTPRTTRSSSKKTAPTTPKKRKLQDMDENSIDNMAE